MRAREILDENYNKSLSSDLDNILVGAKGSGATQISTSDVVDQLFNMGYSVSINSIISLLSDSPVVLNATPEMINLVEPDGASANQDNEDDSAERVADMAQNATDIS